MKCTKHSHELKVSSITGIGNKCKILMVHLLSMEIILFSLLLASYCSPVVNSACQEQILSYSSNKDLSVIKTSPFYFSLFTYFIYLFFYLLLFIYFFFEKWPKFHKICYRH